MKIIVLYDLDREGDIMPKLLCSRCQVELKPVLNGVQVIEMASFGPYKLWQADEWGCPSCKVNIVAGFSRESIEHYEEGFKELLEAFKSNVSLLRLDFENSRQVSEFNTTK